MHNIRCSQRIGTAKVDRKRVSSLGDYDTHPESEFLMPYKQVMSETNVMHVQLVTLKNLRLVSCGDMDFSKSWHLAKNENFIISHGFNSKKL